MMTNLVKRVITSIVLIILLCFGLFYSDYSWKFLTAIFLLFCFYEFYNLINRIYKNKIFILFLILLIGLYLFLFYLILVRLKIEYGEDVILMLLIACIFSDIGGYCVGKLIGGPKLTSISPNKTISGALGSIIFTVLGTTLFVNFLSKIVEDLFVIHFSIMIYTWLFFMSILCQIGDLIISY